MKHIVITGGTRGIGNGLAEGFLGLGYHVTISGTSETSCRSAFERLSLNSTSQTTGSTGEKSSPLLNTKLTTAVCDVSIPSDIEALWNTATTAAGPPDIWINNAGINQPDRLITELSVEEYERVVSVNLLGTIHATRIVYRNMTAIGDDRPRYIYNMEGFGSDGRTMPGLSIYGTSKRALTYFTASFIKETEGSLVRTCFLSPGMVLTDFLLEPLRAKPEEAARLARIYRILADLPEVVTPYLVRKIDQNTKHGAKIAWLTTQKIIFRFLTAPFAGSHRPDIMSLL